MIFDIILTVLFCWLAFKALKLAFKITWGVAKVIAVILFILSIPALVGAFMVAGGLVLLVPLALVIASVGILKACS